MADSPIKQTLIDRSMKQVTFFMILFLAGGWFTHRFLLSWEIKCKRVGIVNCECFSRKYGITRGYQHALNVIGLDIEQTKNAPENVYNRLILDSETGQATIDLPSHLVQDNKLTNIADGLAGFLANSGQGFYQGSITYPPGIRILAWSVLALLLILFFIPLWGTTVILDPANDRLKIKGGFRIPKSYALSQISGLDLSEHGPQLRIGDDRKENLKGFTPSFIRVLAARLNRED